MTNYNSEYVKMKYRLFFDFMDRDKDGFLTKEDFFTNAKNLGKHSKASLSTKVAYQRDMMSWWVLYSGDDQLDDKISKTQFLERGWDYLTAASTKHDIKKHYNLLFDYIDRDQDGNITEKELLLYFQAHEWKDDDQVRAIFLKLDKNGDGSVTREELVHAGVQFWCSDDPETGCDWLYRPRDA